MNPKKTQKTPVYSTIVALLLGQIACVTLVLLGLAIAGGLFIDNRMGTKPAWTLIFVGISVPISVVLMLWIVRKALAKLNSDSNPNDTDKEL